MSVPRARLLELMKAQCKVFSTTYNPEGIRMGNKVLRQRPRGPALAAYYPRKVLTVKDMHREFRPVMDFYDEEEGRRLEHLASLRSRGKGATKKKAGSDKK